MAPPRSPDPRVPELQRQLAREIAERKQNEARLAKQNHALSVFNLMNVDVEQKATSLRTAATRIGTAYSVAAGRTKMRWPSRIRSRPWRPSCCSRS